MNHGNRKWPSIDVLKLYSGALPGFEDDMRGVSSGAVVNAGLAHNALRSDQKWNQWLQECLDKNNLPELMKVRYGIQSGMDDLVKSKLDTPGIAEMFCRWTKSIEDTARKIIKRRIPLPNDNALDKEFHKKAMDAKRMRDLEFDRFLSRSAF